MKKKVGRPPLKEVIDMEEDVKNILSGKEIITPKNFNATTYWNRIKNQNIDMMPKDNLAQRMLVLKWCLADRKTRKPKYFMEVANLIGVSRTSLYKWISDENYLPDTYSMITSRAMGPAALTAYFASLLDGVMKGEKWAMALYSKHILKEGSGLPSGAKTPKFHEEAMEKAKELEALNGGKTLKERMRENA